MKSADSCGVCAAHGDAELCTRYEIGRSRLWLLRHHPDPSPLPGWLLLDSLRHLGGPGDFEPEEALAWGSEVQRACLLVKTLTGCDRVYIIGFGEGARHLHLHLIPRFSSDSATAAWSVADHYRAVERGEAMAAEPVDVAELVQKARMIYAPSQQDG
ncbi:HIT family protein [Cyanobium sp. WAJ14-Wanaka]|uniref:HIT family protein n=1 Tax=Cyanobium sp. WAJ14-Wanaka TaxID=2823725 RepID=UPI0020CBBA69|nr:diadenosine tetraphosphate hydrolase [Cyanobium sp. WAJ14-Wanaka]